MKFFAISILMLLTHHCFAIDIEAKMLAKGSAVLLIDGKQHMMREGVRSPEGVLLVSADGKQAVIEVEGKTQKITLSKKISTQFTQAEKTEARIASGDGGHFRTAGLINGIPVDFMVDTGATTIAMNYHEAERLGIDYRSGSTITVSTANGLTQNFVVNLSKVSVGNIELRNIQAAVSTTDSPTIILLGNSYLGRLDMSVTNGVLILKEKFASGTKPKNSTQGEATKVEP
jgi:aspartyl protease family protein